MYKYSLLCRKLRVVHGGDLGVHAVRGLPDRACGDGGDRVRLEGDVVEAHSPGLVLVLVVHVEPHLRDEAVHLVVRLLVLVSVCPDIKL